MTHTNGIIYISAHMGLISISAIIIVMLLASSGFIFTKATAYTSTLDSDANQISAVSMNMKMESNSDNNSGSNMQIQQTQEPTVEGQLLPSLSSSFSFNPDMPLTIPLVDGYYNGTRVFFVHTETSDKNMADMMTQMINFPTLYVPELSESIREENLSKVYVFTNGIPGSGPYGGGPSMFQIDVLDSIPGQDNYTHLRAPYLVTWNDNTTARILTSVQDVMKAKENGELTLQRADNMVVNAPILAWSIPEESVGGQTANKNKTASTIDKIFLSTPNFDGQVIHIDTDNYTARIKLNPIK